MILEFCEQKYVGKVYLKLNLEHSTKQEISQPKYKIFIVANYSYEDENERHQVAWESAILQGGSYTHRLRVILHVFIKVKQKKSYVVPERIIDKKFRSEDDAFWISWRKINGKKVSKCTENYHTNNSCIYMKWCC